MGERRLTVRDRIIVHLAGFSRYAEEFECPQEVCQSGISEAIGKSRAHTTLELNRMKEAGLLTERLAHVKGAKSKRKTYALTQPAFAREKEIAQHMERLEVQILEGGDSRPYNGQAAASALVNTLGLSRALAFDMILASGGAIDLDMEMSHAKSRNGSRTASTAIFQEPGAMSMDASILESNESSKRGRLDEALAIINRAIETNIGDPAIHRARYTRASLMRKQGSLASALKEINSALELSGKAQDTLMVGRCQMEKAMIVNAQGNAEYSLKLLDSCTKTFEKEGSQVDLIRCGINRGLLLSLNGLAGPALEVLEDTMDLAKRAGQDRMGAYCMVNMTDLLNRQCEYARSEKLCIGARDIFSVLDEPVMLAASLFNLGVAQAGQGKNKEAITNLDSAIGILEENDALAARIDWLEKYAEILNGMGQQMKAEIILQKI